MKMRDRKRRFMARFSYEPELITELIKLHYPWLCGLCVKPYNSKRVRIGKKYQ